VQQAWPSLTVSGLRNVQVLHGLTLDQGPRTLRLTALPCSQALPSGDIELNVEINDVEGAGRPLYCGVVEIAEQMAPPPASPPIPLGLERFHLPLAEAYKQWLFHGPVFQGIEQVEGISPSAMVALCRPSSPDRCISGTGAGNWLIDPVIFDSALQMIILWIRTYQDATPLPNRFHSYQRFGSLSDSIIRCVLQATTDPQNSVFAVDIGFFDANHKLVGLLKQMECTHSRALNRLARPGYRRNGEVSEYDL
jgi:hypothetical protein